MNVAHELTMDTGSEVSKVSKDTVEDQNSWELFEDRHLGPNSADIKEMLKFLGEPSVDSFIGKVVPQGIRLKQPLVLTDFPRAFSEVEVLSKLRSIASKNQVWRSYIGTGYYGTVTPAVIQRNILEDPGWYTQYTPYQPEISQGRLEALLNFQTMVAELSALPIANASLLDESTAAAEAMCVCLRVKDNLGTLQPQFFVADDCHPQTIAVVVTRAKALGVKIIVGSHQSFDAKNTPGLIGVLLQYPSTFGEVFDFKEFCEKVHAAKALVTVAADILALTVISPPGDFGADIAVGNTQRFGVPLGYGGPHAAYFATKDEYKRFLPGRLVGVSKDSSGMPALRLSLQTREQHIRREKATSNICTAQVLLAIMSSMYGVYHGREGLQRIAKRVNHWTRVLASGLQQLGLVLENKFFFDTLKITLKGQSLDEVIKRAKAKRINLRAINSNSVGISLDETVLEEDVRDILEVFGWKDATLPSPTNNSLPSSFARRANFLKQAVFSRYHTETELLRYIKRLCSKDLSLGTAMIPLGSCTMKLNATTEMLPVTFREFSEIHPFAPNDQVLGYKQLIAELGEALKNITGFSAVSVQPNAGSQGEYAGILAIRAYQTSKGDSKRDICLIPKSAHGTNPASASMAGLDVVVVDCDSEGNIDISDLTKKVGEFRDRISLLMVTYPSTHGVFEERIQEASALVHSVGGEVYMDGANLNALVGLCRPLDLGADVCHINLHKTFCIPHGGGGPGMGPIGVKDHLAPFLPNHPVIDLGYKGDPVSAAPFGSASILTISWAYIALMGASGLKRATEVAILNANYIAKRLHDSYPVLYRGKNNFVAHECILDLRHLKKTSGVEVEDVAKRLMDYGFHAPTISFPVSGTMMVEPTESESKQELDRFCDAMISIREEIRAIEEGRMDLTNNPLKNAPHTAVQIASSDWNRPYTREMAAFPTPGLKDFKFWPAVGRIDAVYGDRNLVCTCPPLDVYDTKLRA